MTKEKMARELINSPAWDGGTYDKLMRASKQEIVDIYDMMQEAEEDYYNNLYAGD